MQPATPAPQALELDDLTLARAQRGDGAAFGQLVHRYERTIWSYLWRMLGPAASRPLIEDLFQETFLGVYRALPRFSGQGPARLSTWILAIATRVALYRRRGLRRQVASGKEVGERGDEGAQARGIERQTMVPALVRALADLSPDHRAIFVLREFHELDYEEIARALQIEVGTVRSRLHRARESLRGALEAKTEKTEKTEKMQKSEKTP
jgi:RNA polymerase sigma-70 factor, ECF subfamily